MHLAAEMAKIEIVEMLLKAGLDLSLRDRVRILTCNIPELNRNQSKTMHLKKKE